MPEQHSFITLTTDFGSKDPYVGIMKGVILDINPKVTIIDISHEISPQDIIEASIILHSASRYFPPKTIHVAVVDPGVGGPRIPILVSTPKYYFIGPDNGIFSFAYKEDHRVIHITADHYFLPSDDSTFHGRDIFASVAAWLSKGITINNFGETIQDYIKISIPRPQKIGDNVLEGEVIYIDRFGNVASNISRDKVRTFTSEPSRLRILVKGIEIEGINRFYAQAMDKGPAAIINSSGFLEIYLFQGNAEKALGLKRGNKIRVMV